LGATRSYWKQLGTLIKHLFSGISGKLPDSSRRSCPANAQISKAA